MPADDSGPVNGNPAADSSRHDRVSRDPRVRPGAEQKEKNTSHTTPTPASKPPSNAPRGPKDIKTNAAKTESPSSALTSKPIQSQGKPPRVICGFLESSPEPQSSPAVAAKSDESPAPGISKSVLSRPGANDSNTAKDSSSMQDPQPANSSKSDKTVIKCPLTPVMYNDANQLRHAVEDLSKFLHVAEKRLKELEQSSNEEHVWEMAIAELEK